MDYEISPNKQLTLEQELVLEEKIYAELDEAELIEDAIVPIEELHNLATQSPNFRIFPKIEECVNIAARSEKDLEVREFIMTEVVDNLAPILHISREQGEEIPQDRLNDLANMIAEMIMEHNHEDDFKQSCLQAFIEVSTIR